MGGNNGSWTGRDPRLRNLRTASAIVIMGLLIWVVITRHVDVATIGTLSGMLLVILGFEIGVAWPKPIKRPAEVEEDEGEPKK